MCGDIARIAVATPGREGSILAIARAASRQSILTRFYTSLYTAKYARVAKYFSGALLRRIESEFNRRAYHGIPSEIVRSSAVLPELAHVGMRRLLEGRSDSVGGLMYWSKDRFDKSVAKLAKYDEWDVLIALQYSSAAMLECSRRRKNYGVLNFVSSHPFYYNMYLRQHATLQLNHCEMIPSKVSDRLEREIEYSDLILVPSNFVARQLWERGYPSGKIVIEPYGVDLQMFHPAARDTETPETRGVPLRGKTRCLFVGQISYRKGIQVLIQAARQLQNIPAEIWLVGPIVCPELLENLPGNVLYLGKSFHGGVADIMRQADIFILPSLEDAYPLVTMEAMASGLAVIISQNAGTSELIINDVNGLTLPAGDIEATKNAIISLVEDSAKRSRLAKAGMITVREGITWDTYGQRVINLIMSRLNGKL